MDYIIILLFNLWYFTYRYNPARTDECCILIGDKEVCKQQIILSIVLVFHCIIYVEDNVYLYILMC